MGGQVILGDCLEVMRGIPDKSIDMILCDLPYGTISCKWDVVIPFEPLWGQYKRVIKDRGAIVLTASQPFTSALIMSNPKMFRFSWVWDKKFGANFALAKYQPIKVHEDIVVFSIKPSVYNPQVIERDTPIKLGANKCKSESSAIAYSKKEYDKKIYTTKQPISIIPISSRSEKRGLHPTQKPVALFEYLIKTYSTEGDTVLDNCAGSGTTGVACKNLNRDFILIEKDENCYNLIKERLCVNMVG